MLGRSRATEDVDLLVPKINKKIFKTLFNDLREKGFECINSSKPEDAFEMLEGHAIRFFKETPVPNIEFKIIKNKIHEDAFNNRLIVKLKEKDLFISPL